MRLGSETQLPNFCQDPPIIQPDWRGESFRRSACYPNGGPHRHADYVSLWHFPVEPTRVEHVLSLRWSGSTSYGRETTRMTQSGDRHAELATRLRASASLLEWLAFGA